MCKYRFYVIFTCVLIVCTEFVAAQYFTYDPLDIEDDEAPIHKRFAQIPISGDKTQVQTQAKARMISQMDHGPIGLTSSAPGPPAAQIPTIHVNSQKNDMLSQIDHREGLVDEKAPITNVNQNQNQNQYRTMPQQAQGPSLPGQGAPMPGSTETELVGDLQESGPMMVTIPGVTGTSQEFMTGNGNQEQFQMANQMMDQMNHIRNLIDMLERSSGSVTSAAELAGSSTVLLKNVITSMIQGAQQLNLQIDTMQRLSTELSKEVSKPLGGVQPLIENQLKVVSDMTKNVENMLLDITQIRNSFTGYIFIVPYVLGVIAGTFLVSLLLIVLVCCSMRRRKSKTVSGVKGEWSMQPTRHHAGSNPRYEKNIEISYPFAVKKLAKMNK